MNGIIEKKLIAIGNSINKALDNPDIIRLLEPFGYGTLKILHGKELWETANQAIAKYLKSYNEQDSETTEHQWKKMYANYMVVLKLSRIAFRDNPITLSKLAATGHRGKSFSGWLRDARTLYINLACNPDNLTRIGTFGVTATDLAYSLQQLNDLEQAFLLQFPKEFDIEQSISECDHILDELFNWYSDFRSVARIALYKQPLLLEELEMKP